MDKNFILIEQNYRYLFDNASDAIWVHDMEGRFLVANKALERLAGYTLAELRNMSVTRFLTPELIGGAQEVKYKLLTGAPLEQPYEQRLVRRDGSIRVVMMSTSLVVLNEEAKGFQNIARDVTEEKQLQENMKYYIQQITRAQEDERKRLARELHDDTSPSLILLLQRLDAIAARRGISAALKKELTDLRKQAEEALEGVRLCAQGLRPRILDDLGLIPALEWGMERTENNFGIKSSVEVVGEPHDLPPEMQVILFRIAQESITNVRKYARATRAYIKLEFLSDHIQMTVTDNGRGFDMPEKVESMAASGKLGIIGMQERARLLGGTLTVTSQPGKGTQVIADIPL